jgi:hypothetical protein
MSTRTISMALGSGSVLSLLIAGGCAGTRGGPLPTQAPPWSVTKSLPEMSVPVETHYIYVAPPSNSAGISEIENARDVNHDGAPDLRIIFSVGTTVPVTKRVLVLSGTTLPAGDISDLRRQKRLVTDRKPLPFWKRYRPPYRYRRSRLGDLNGDGRPERAVLRTSHATVHSSCGEGQTCTNELSASELTLYSGKDEIARVGGDWYGSPGNSSDPRNVVGGYRQAGDWNSDGRPDLLYADGALGVMVLAFSRSGSDTQMRAQKLARFGPYYFDGPMPASVDLNSDGKPEIVGQAIFLRGEKPDDPYYEDWLTLALVTPR